MTKLQAHRLGIELSGDLPKRNKKKMEGERKYRVELEADGGRSKTRTLKRENDRRSDAEGRSPVWPSSL